MSTEMQLTSPAAQTSQGMVLCSKLSLESYLPELPGNSRALRQETPLGLIRFYTTHLTIWGSHRRSFLTSAACPELGPRVPRSTLMIPQWNLRTYLWLTKGLFLCFKQNLHGIQRCLPLNMTKSFSNISQGNLWGGKSRGHN